MWRIRPVFAAMQKSPRPTAGIPWTLARTGRGRAGGDGPPGNDPARFQWHGFRYSIEQRAGRVVHKESRQDASGRTIAQIKADVQFAVGSGRQAVSYLIDRDGFLFGIAHHVVCPGQAVGHFPGL